MNAQQLREGLAFIEGVAEYYFTDNDFDSVIWLTDGVKPTLAEVEQAYAHSQAAKAAAAAALATLKESAKAKLVAGEPLTAEEASVLVI
jgi:hypothetical protein